MKYKMFDDGINIRKMECHLWLIGDFWSSGDFIEERGALAVCFGDQAIKGVGGENDALMVSERMTRSLEEGLALFWIHIGYLKSEVWHRYTIAC